MKKMGFVLIVVSFLSIIFLSQLKIINHVQDYDEGVYLTTFLLIHSGHPAYKETFLSQPPGFLLSVYPGFILFGQTLQAAKLTMSMWSLIGLLAIIWLCIELKNKWAGIFTLGILYSIPYYFNQTTVFHSDVLIGTFSLITLASFFRYKNTKQIVWFIIAIFFLNLGFWTKFDIFLFPLLFVIFFIVVKNKYIHHKDLIKLISIAGLVSISFFLVFIIPFGIQYVIADTLGLRAGASHLQQQSFLFFTYIRQSIPVLLLTICALFVTIFRKESFYFPLLPLCLWVGTIFFIFVWYKPLFIHHMVIYTIPLAIYVSVSIIFWLKKQTTYYPLIIFCFLLFVSINYISTITIMKIRILSPDEQKAIYVINQYTRPTDIVVSDEGILTGISHRLPPPELSDISYVRLASKNLPAEKLKQIVDTTKPKLIISWNGRLASIPEFTSMLSNYKALITIHSKTIYLRSPN